MGSSFFLRNGSPVDVGFSQCCEPLPKDVVGRVVAIGVGVDDFLRLVSCELHDLPVSCDVGYFEVEGHSALLRAFEVSRPPELEVGLRDEEAVVGGAHDVDALCRLLAEFAGGDEDAE